MKIVISVVVFALSFNVMNFQVAYQDCAIDNDKIVSKTGKCISKYDCLNYGFFPANASDSLPECKTYVLLPGVCCPLLEESPTYRKLKSKTLRKCWEYTSLLSLFIRQGDGFHPLVTFGTKAVQKEFPHVAAIGYGRNDSAQDVEWLCGGTLISENFVLTAAHCAGFRDLNPVLVRLGELDFASNPKRRNNTIQDIPISEIIVHPRYVSATHYNDIALLRLKREPTFGDYVRPACLNPLYNIPGRLEAIGWGKTDFAGFRSDHLLKVWLNVSDYETCYKKYEKIHPKKLPNGIDDATQICVGGYSPEDTCEGDSGGPLHYNGNVHKKFERYHIVVGITSFGHGCGFGKTPAVFTRVSTYIPWIESIVWP